MSEIYTDPPQSRNEAIIKATIDGTEYTAPPQSRMEDLLLELKEAIEQGGGGGTSDYSQLSNKPSINGVTLTGNKTSSDLGLMPEYEVDNTPTESSENLITSGGVWSADKSIKDKLQGTKTATGNPITVTDAEAMNAESVKVELEPKQDLHGYSKPWAGGAGKNLLPMTVDGLKALNTESTWSGNIYSVNGVDFEILTDNDGNVQGIDVNGTASAITTLKLIDDVKKALSVDTPIIINGCPSNGSQKTYYIQANSVGYDTGDGVSGNVPSSMSPIMICVADGATASNLLFQPMIRLATESDATFAPYSNICPISGYSEVNVENNTDTYTIDLGQTVYGGEVDVVNGGGNPNTHKYIEISNFDNWNYQEYANFKALYKNLNELGYPPIKNASDREVISDKFDCVESGVQQPYGVLSIYTNGNIYFWNNDNAYASKKEMIAAMNNIKPAICYELATPSSVSTTPTDIALLENTNNISTDGTNIQLKYQPTNVIGECKAYTDEQCAKVLPQPPTIDGTYHLECSVSSGNPTITWVLNS